MSELPISFTMSAEQLTYLFLDTFKLVFFIQLQIDHNTQMQKHKSLDKSTRQLESYYRQQIDPTTTNVWDLPIFCDGSITHHVYDNKRPSKHTNRCYREHYKKDIY